MTFFLTMVFVALVFWRPQEWLVPALYGWPVLDAVVVIASIACIMELHTGTLRPPSGTPVVWMLAGLWFAAVMSHIANTYWDGMMMAIPEAFKYCYFTLLLFLVLDRPRRLRAMSWLFVLMTSVMAVHALLQVKRGYGFAGQEPLRVIPAGGTEMQERTLFFGIFNDPNDMAQILVTAMPFCFALFRRNNIFTFAVGAGFAWLLTEAALSTHSRGGYIGMAVMWSSLVALLLPARMTPAVLLGILGGALLLCPLSAALLDVSAHDRVVFWGIANQFFKEKPIFGIGYGMFWQVADERAAHNAFVSCYTTLGLFGYWLWFGLLQHGIMQAWRTRVALTGSGSAEERWLRRFAGLAMAAMGGYAASAYFLTRDFVYPVFFLFAILGAIPILARKMRTDGPDPVPYRPERDLLGWGTLGAVASVFYIYFSIVLLNRAFYGT